MADAMAMVRRARVEALSRDFQRFTGSILTRILQISQQINARVFISKHFTERMVDRDFSERIDRQFMFKLLSLIFEKHGELFLKNQDVFVRYKTFCLMIVSDELNGVKQIRLNTFLRCDSEDWFITAKNGRPATIIEIALPELMGYVPITLKE